MNETFLMQENDELTKKELKQIKADDQAIQNILLGLLENIYAAVDSCENAQEIWLHVQQMMKEWSRHVTIFNQTKDLHTADYTQLYDFLKYNQKEVDDLRAERLAKTQDPLALMTSSNNPYTFPVLHQDQPSPSMNMGQDRQMQMVGGNGGNQFRQYARLIVVSRIANQNPNGNGNLVGARVKGNATGHNDLDEIEEVDANYILMANLQQASTSSTQTDKAPVYDPDGSTEIDNNVIFEVYSVKQSGRTVEQHPANVEETRVLCDSLYNNLVYEVEKVNSINGKLRETNVELTTELARYKNQERCFEISQEKYDKLERCYQKSVYQEQCITKKINALHLSSGKQITTLNEEISNLNKQLSMEKSTVSFLLEEKKKLKSYFKIREDALLDKQIQLENKIKELDSILVNTGQSIQMMHMLSPKPDSFYRTEQKMALGYQNPFYLKQAQQQQQSLYNGKVLTEKHDPPVVHDSEETLQLAQEIRLKMNQLNKERKPENYTKINHLSGVFVRQLAKSCEEL
nr:hypothetical protein [Tanacetum cinerariifolium]